MFDGRRSCPNYDGAPMHSESNDVPVHSCGECICAWCEEDCYGWDCDVVICGHVGEVYCSPTHMRAACVECADEHTDNTYYN